MGGRLGDYFGRKKSMYGACLVISISMIASAFSPNYIAFAAFHLIYSTCLPISWVSLASCSTEYFSPGTTIHVR